MMMIMYVQMARDVLGFDQVDAMIMISSTFPRFQLYVPTSTYGERRGKDR